MSKEIHTIKCLRCGSENRATLFHCEKCGTNLHLESLPKINMSQGQSGGSGEQFLPKTHFVDPILWIVVAGTFFWFLVLVYILSLGGSPEAGFAAFVPAVIFYCGLPFPLLLIIFLLMRLFKCRAKKG